MVMDSTVVGVLFFTVTDGHHNLDHLEQLAV